MPKYFFNVRNESPSQDDIGRESPNDEMAWREATTFAGALDIDQVQDWDPEVATKHQSHFSASAEVEIIGANLFCIARSFGQLMLQAIG